MKEITPLEDRVLVKADSVASTTKSGIIIPETLREKPSTGTVVSMGSGKDGVAMTVKIGDKVIYGKVSGTQVVIKEEEYTIMREGDILAII